MPGVPAEWLGGPTGAVRPRTLARSDRLRVAALRQDRPDKPSHASVGDEPRRYPLRPGQPMRDTRRRPAQRMAQQTQAGMRGIDRPIAFRLIGPEPTVADDRTVTTV